MGVILIGYIVTLSIAIDKGIALLGVIRFIPACLFWILWNNLDDGTRYAIRDLLPDVASFFDSRIGSNVCHSPMRELLFCEGRLGGVFQYSNTYVLFLLVAVICVAFRERKERKEYIELAMLSAGIILSGSRSVFLLFALTLMILLIFGRMNRVRMTAVAVTAVLVYLVLQWALEMDIGRLLKLSFDSSTLNGRVLYWSDAVPGFAENSLG